MSELANNSNMKNKTNTYYCAQYELKFGTKDWYDKHMKCVVAQSRIITSFVT